MTRRFSARYGPLLVCAIALLVHAIYLFEGTNDPTFLRPIVDSKEYDDWARQMLAGTYRPTTPYYHPPLLTYLLFWAYRVFDGSVLAAKVILSLLGVGSAALTCLLARPLVGRGPALAAGLAAALYGPLVFFDTQLLPAGPATFLNLLTLWLVVWACRSERLRLWALAGASLGAAALAVPNILFVAPWIPAWLWLCKRRGLYRKSPAAATCAFALGCLLLISPVTVRNYLASGEFCLISYNGGVNLYVGNNPDWRRTVAVRPGYDWEALDKMPLRYGARSAMEAEAFFVRRVATYAVGEPLDFLRGLAAKARLFVNARELPRNFDLYVFRGYSRLLAVLLWRWGPFAFPFGALLPLAVVGIVVSVRRSAEAQLLGGYLLLYTASSVLFFVAARYRIVLVPVLIAFGVRGATWLWKRKPSTRSAAALALGLAAALAANTPVAAPLDGVPFEAELHYFLGSAAEAKGEDGRAEEDYARALALAPEYPQPYNALGLLRMRQGRAAEAMAHLERAVALKPDFAEALSNLGALYERQGAEGPAETCYRAAVRHKPEVGWLHENLGRFLFYAGREDEAAHELRQSTELDPRTHDAYQLLSWILATSPVEGLRDGSQAVKWMEELCTEVDRTNPLWLETLAAAYGEAGRFDAAVDATKKAVGLWRAAGRYDVANQSLARLALYERRQPLRRGAPAPP